MSRHQPEHGTGDPVRTGRHRSSGSHATTTIEVHSRSLAARGEPQHFLNFFPLPQGQAALRPTLAARTDPAGASAATARMVSGSWSRGSPSPRSSPSRPRAPRRPRHPDLPAPACGTRSWAEAAASTAWPAARVPRATRLSVMAASRCACAERQPDSASTASSPNQSASRRPAWSGKDARATAASSSSAAFRMGMIAGKARRRLISAFREARSRVNSASSHGSASR